MAINSINPQGNLVDGDGKPAYAREVIPMRIQDEMRVSYTRYAMSVIVGRALPDVRDGLKPVHRRILYAMYDQNMTPDRRREKCASAVGEVLKKYHPHGDQSVYDALVRMAQDFSMRYRLVDGQGNFGCFTGDTRVLLLDGTTPTFEELAARPKDEIFPVYSVNGEGEIAVGEGRFSRVTRKDAPLVELVFDDGSTVRCTPDHKFLLRDGSWKEAATLTVDDSLMAGHFDTAKINAKTSDYLRVRQPKTGQWQFVHRLSDEFNSAKGLAREFDGAFVRHHKNGNRFDNSPSNIERMDWLEHFHLHAAQMKGLWTSDEFRTAQRAGVAAYYNDNPQARQIRRERMSAQNKSVLFRAQSGPRVGASLRARFQNDPQLALEISARMKKLWADADYRAKMSEALLGVEKAPMSPDVAARVKRIIAQKSRAMWAKDAKRAQITQAIVAALSSEAVRERLSELSRARWQAPQYRAKFAPDHHAQMARALWAKPQTRELHRDKIARQWNDEAFRAAHREGRRKGWARRQDENPDVMRELAAKSSASLQLKWREPDYKSRVMRTKIAGFAAKLVALHGAGALSPELYDESRDANWIPNAAKAVAYFGSFEALSQAAQTHNHRVVFVQHLNETCDVYDITVDEHHNFMLANGCVVHNSVDGDAAAAYRYTEARLAPLAMELMRDIESETVDFGPNFSETTTEPTVFPSVYPNLLVNGSAGIAVGMATNIPPHNLGEVCDAVGVLIDNPEASISDLMAVCPAPDFPTAGLILGTKGATSAYHTGRGSVIMQARATIEPFDNGRSAIIITELPYQVNKATLIENIAALARDKRIEGISELRDESDRQGMRIVMEIKRDANPNVVLNFLYKHTALRTSFGINMLAIVDGQPKVLTLKTVLEAFVRHREDVITRRSKFQLRKAEARGHILEGLRAILASIDDVIALIRSSASREDARNRLMNEGVPAYADGRKTGEQVVLSEIQSNAVLDMRLGQLTQLDRMKIDDEYADLMKEIERLRGILESPQKVRGIIKADMVRIKKEYGDPRRTQIFAREAQELKPEDLIAEEDVVVTITRDGYIKKLPKDTYNVQGRGGRGKVGLNKKEEDMIEHLFVCSTHHTLLIFTNRGKVYQLRAFEIPTASRQAKGTPIVNLLQVERGEYVTAALNIAEFSDDRYLFMVTRDGTVKKTAMSAYATKLQKGIIAINLEGSDELRFVFQTDGKKEIILASRQGMSVRFNEFPIEGANGALKGGVKATGRNTSGVYGMRFKSENDYIVGAVAADEETVMLTVSEKGLGKRTKIEDYRLTGRGGTGVITLKVNDKTGELVSLQSVKDDEELLIITKNGIVIRQRIEAIRETGRVAQGVKLINLDDDDSVAAVAKILQEPEGDEAQASDGSPEGEEVGEVGEVEETVEA